jgi:hypothetical protein
VGDWEITLDEENHFTVTKNGNFVAAEGRCTLTQEQLVFNDEKGPWACTDPGEENGIYTWALDGKTLTLTAVEDQCPGRTYVFTTHPLSKQD